MPLRCEQNTPEMEREVLETADAHGIIGSPWFEHGQWWIVDNETGAAWSVNDLNDNDFSFEQVAEGEE